MRIVAKSSRSSSLKPNVLFPLIFSAVVLFATFLFFNPLYSETDYYSLSAVADTVLSNKEESPRNAASLRGENINVVGGWKLWHDMNTAEQGEAIQRLHPYVKKYGDMYNKGRIVKHGQCDNFEFASGHSLCG